MYLVGESSISQGYKGTGDTESGSRVSERWRESWPQWQAGLHSYSGQSICWFMEMSQLIVGDKRKGLRCPGKGWARAENPQRPFIARASWVTLWEQIIPKLSDLRPRRVVSCSYCLCYFTSARGLAGHGHSGAGAGGAFTISNVASHPAGEKRGLWGVLHW